MSAHGGFFFSLFTTTTRLFSFSSSSSSGRLRLRDRIVDGLTDCCSSSKEDPNISFMTELLCWSKSSLELELEERAYVRVTLSASSSLSVAGEGTGVECEGPYEKHFRYCLLSQTTLRVIPFASAVIILSD